MSVVLFTAPSHELARTIIYTLLDESSIACGTIIPGCTSIYRWQGAIHESTEAQALIKLSSTNVPQVIARIKELHSYDVPEIVALEADDALPAYLQWVMESSTPTQ